MKPTSSPIGGKCSWLTSVGRFILDQLVTIFTLATTNAATPSQLAQLGQLQSAITDKRKELNDMVCNSTLVYL